MTKELNHTKLIKEWLGLSKERIWKQNDENPNCFFSDHLEALYVYADRMSYWEDVRANKEILDEFPIPKSAPELFTLLKIKS